MKEAVYKIATVMQYAALTVLVGLLVYSTAMSYWKMVGILTCALIIIVTLMVKTHIPWRDIEKELGGAK